jgi:hypothetical protein
MSDRWILSLIVAVLLSSVSGCGGGDGAPGGDRQPRTNPFLGDGGVADFQVTEEFEIDLTGDGVPEEVVVSVHGEDPAALEIEMSVVGRREAIQYTSVWSSADYPEIEQARARDELTPWVAGQAVRERLQDLLAEESIQPLTLGDIDPAAVRRELRFEEWRLERGLPASMPLTPEEEAQLATVVVPDDRVQEVLTALPGRPGLTYVAGSQLRTIAWSTGLDRFITVSSCC